MFVAPLVLAVTLAPAEKRLVRRPIQIKEVAALPVQPPVIAVPVGGPALPPVGIPFAVRAVGGSPAATVGGIGDPAVLENARLGTGDDDLLAFFRRRTPPGPSPDNLAALVKRMSGADTGAADKAQAELTAVGPFAVPLLREAANNADLGDGALRARQCLANNEPPVAAALVVHAARLLATRKPAGAAGVLVAYLPFAEDDTAHAEIEAALVAVTLRGSKADPAVLAALEDSLPARRAAAAHALCQAGGAAFQAEVRPLLKDPRPSVRLRAALGLALGYDAEAVPVLIDLLAELGPVQRGPVEAYLAGLAGEWAVASPRGPDALSRRLRRDVWAAWWKDVDGPALLAELRARTISNADREKLAGLLEKLGNPSAATREAASADIIGMGKKAAPMLRQAVAGPDARVAALARKCLDAVEPEADGPLPTAAPRLLALRRPPGTVEALIAYLPFAESPDAQGAIVEILVAVGCPGGKADAALVKALADPVAARRAAAADVLCKTRATAHLPALRKLLADKDPLVVLRTATGLATLREREAVPALIRLLAELPLEQAYDVEEMLDRIAGDKGPTEGVAADAASRTKAVAAWNRWWKDNGKKIDLARFDLASRERGVYVFVEQHNPTTGTAGRVLEVDPTGKVRWQITGINFPTDAQILRNGNVLVVDQNRVSERDRNGQVINQRFINNIFHAERLRNGHTFIACRNGLMVINAGNNVLTHNDFNNYLVGARRFRDGSMAYVANTGNYVRLDAQGQQVKTVSLNQVLGNRNFTSADILPDGRVVVSDPSNGAVHCFDADGKPLWHCAVPAPGTPRWTAGGSVLVPSNNATGICEIDRAGKLVKKWEGFSFRPFCVYRR